MVAYWETAAHPANGMFRLCRYLTVNLVFSYLGFYTVNLFLIVLEGFRLCLTTFFKASFSIESLSAKS